MPDPALRLETERLVIRRFEPSDGSALHSYLSRPEAVAFEPYPVQSLDECRAEVRRRSGDPDFWAVCLAASGELAGHLYFHLDEPPHWRTYELGYVFHPDHWGRGYATEAVRGLLDDAFARREARRVVARCNPLNTASWRLLERAGFRREGHFRSAASFATGPDGSPVWHDAYAYAVLASEWPGSA